MSDVTVELTKQELLLAMRQDCVTFLSFYLGDELTLRVPDFHEEIWAELLLLVDQANHDKVTETLQKLFAVPREHAKSTLAKLASILFLRYTSFAFTLYVSKTNGIAKNAIRDIIAWLQSDRDQELHGPSRVIKSSETDSLWMIDISIRSPDGSVRVKHCIFKALGSEQQVRGLLINSRRPEIIIIDDVEDLDNTKDVNQQKNLDEWVLGSLMKAKAKRAVVMFLGNAIRRTTLLMRLAKNPKWNPTIFGCLVKDAATGELRALWPERYTVEELLNDYKEYRELGLSHVWECEMMNLTQDEILNADMSTVRFVIRPLPEDLIAGALVLDPAFGLEAYHDKSAITVHALITGSSIPAIIDHRVGHWREEGIFDEMLSLSYYWGISTWFIEAEAAQKLLLSQFDLFMQIRQMNRETIAMLPIHTDKKSKPARILAMREALRVGSYALAEGEIDLFDAYKEYSQASSVKDDLPDSGAYGLKIWQMHGQLIKDRGVDRSILTALGDGSPGPGAESIGQSQYLPI